MVTPTAMTSPANTTNNAPTSKSVSISLPDWQARLNDVQVSKDDLNRLVMDYLVIEGYKEAAENFARESGMSSSSSRQGLMMDFDSIQDRMDIRNAIQSGDIVGAIERVNDFDPEILDNNPALYFQLQQQRLIELIRQRKIDEALLFAQEELAPRGEEHPEFLSDLEQTMTLLAYDVDLAAIEARHRQLATGTEGGIGSDDLALEGDVSDDSLPSAVASLLHPAHRQATAAKVNSAILVSQSHGPNPKLPNLLRMLAWGEELLSEKMDFPRMDMLIGNPKELAAKMQQQQQQSSEQSHGAVQHGENAIGSGDVAMM